MTHPELNTAALHERISESINTSIAAEAAHRNLIESLTVEEAEFCLGAVSDQVLEILAKKRHGAYDEEQEALEHHSRKLQSTLMGTLTHLITERELLHGATPQEAEVTAQAHTKGIFDKYRESRNAIYSKDD